MTEAEWLANTDPQSMLELFRDAKWERKLRLFACACIRRIWHLNLADAFRTAVEVAEQYADGKVNLNELQPVVRYHVLVGGATAHEAARYAVRLTARRVSYGAAFGDLPTGPVNAGAVDWSDWHVLDPHESVEQCRLILDVFGNPFRPLLIHPPWLTWNGGTLVSIAHAIYDDRSFYRLPVLADALEDAGCTDDALLAHCRQPGAHVRGCWVIDLLLGKE